MRKLFHDIKTGKLSLEQTIFFLTAIAGIFMYVVGEISNMVLGLGIIAIGVPLVNITTVVFFFHFP